LFESLTHVSRTSQSSHQKLRILSIESLDTVAGSSQPCHQQLTISSPECLILSQKVHNSIVRVSRCCHQTLKILSSECPDTVTGSSKTYYLSFSVLSSEALSPVTRSSHSRLLSLSVPSPLTHTSVGWLLCCSPTMSISSSSLSLCVTLPPNCEDDVGRLEKSTGPPATQSGALNKSDRSTIFLYSFDRNQRSIRDEKYNIMLSGNLKAILHIVTCRVVRVMKVTGSS
jgi:hypothetical protein